MTLVRYYDYVFKEMADRRVDNWAMMSGPGTIMTLIATYLAAVYVFLPAYMKDRKPYSLKNVIYFYNLFQIAACAILIYGISTSGWTTHYTLGCQIIDYSNDPLAVRMLSFVYWTFILKLIELVETVFFILRKKQNQVTKLHVYHHASTAILGWLGVKYIGGGMATFPIMINCFIHILMYTYYWLAALGPEYQKKLAKWKPKLTMAQMIQFCILVTHASQAALPSCKISKVLLAFYIPNVFLIFYGFYDFYVTSYSRKQKTLVLSNGRKNSLINGRKDSLVNGRKDSLVNGLKDSLVKGRKDSLKNGHIQKCG